MGGVDIEDISRTFSHSIVKCPINSIHGMELFEARRIWKQLGFGGELLNKLASTLYAAFRLFEGLDAILLEINPLIITPNQDVVAAASVLELDDDALFRHQALSVSALLGLDRIWRPPTEREREVVLSDTNDPYRGTIRYTEFEGGDIGIINGGGGSLVVQDTIRMAGGRPANYSEWGGNPPERKLKALTEAVASKQGVKGVLVCLNWNVR